jgi:hypothetical protein
MRCLSQYNKTAADGWLGAVLMGNDVDLTTGYKEVTIWLAHLHIIPGRRDEGTDNQ